MSKFNFWTKIWLLTQCVRSLYEYLLMGISCFLIEPLGKEFEKVEKVEKNWKWFLRPFSRRSILWWHVNFDGLKKSWSCKALVLSDNNIWLLGVDRAEVSSLKIWWNGSRRGNREFKGFHHLPSLLPSTLGPKYLWNQLEIYIFHHIKGQLTSKLVSSL